MGLLSKVWFGIDLEAEQARGNELDARLAELNRRKLEQGKMTPEQYTQAEANRLAGATGNVYAEVGQAALEGAKEGFANVVAAPGKAVGAVGNVAGSLVGGILKNIPWWVYLAGAGALFVWMGGLTLVRGRLAKI